MCGQLHFTKEKQREKQEQIMTSFLEMYESKAQHLLFKCSGTKVMFPRKQILVKHKCSKHVLSNARKVRQRDHGHYGSHFTACHPSGQTTDSMSTEYR